MTIRAFTEATAQKFNLELAPLLESCRIAEHLSAGMCRLGNIDLHRTLPGFGLVFDGDTLYPTVLVNRWEYDYPERLSDHSDDFYSGLDYPDIVNQLQAISEAYDHPEGECPFLAEELRVLPVSHGVRYASSGTSIQSTAFGRVGPHVKWNNGRSEGFLTAGHVAQTTGGNVTDGSGSLLGSVVWTFDPSKTSSTIPELDAALVEFDSAYVSSTGQSKIVVAANDTVSISSTQSTDILGFSNHIALGSSSDIYADCYMTNTLITKPGDSGDRVVHQSDIVGMVMGGFTTRNMTIIQAIDFQLTEVSSRSGRNLSI